MVGIIKFWRKLVDGPSACYHVKRLFLINFS